jgi:hypothetical protein
LRPGIVPFPRGFSFAEDGELFLASGVGPEGRGANTILQFTASGALKNAAFVIDDEVNPLDLGIGPDGNVLVSSESPFGSPDATTSIRTYDRSNGSLVRVFSAPSEVPFRRPPGLRFGPDRHLYCVSQDGVIAFDYLSGRYLGVVFSYPRLHNQAIEFFGD